MFSPLNLTGKNVHSLSTIENTENLFVPTDRFVLQASCSGQGNNFAKLVLVRVERVIPNLQQTNLEALLSMGIR